MAGYTRGEGTLTGRMFGYEPTQLMPREGNASITTKHSDAIGTAVR